MFFLTSCEGPQPNIKKILFFYKPFLKNHWCPLGWLFILSISWSIAETIAPYCIKLMIDEIALQTGTPQEIFPSLFWIGGLYIGLIVLLEGSLRLCHLIWIQVVPELKANIRNKSLQDFQQQPFGFFHDIPVGKAVTQYRHLSHCFEQLLSSVLYGVFPTVVSSLLAFLLMYHTSPVVALLFALWYVGMNGVTYFFARQSFAAANDQAEAETKIIGHVGDLFRNDIPRRTSASVLCSDTQIMESLQAKERDKSKKLEWISFKTDLLRGSLSLAMLLFVIIFLMIGWKKNLISLGDFSFITAICLYARRSAWMAAVQLLEIFKTLGVLSQALAPINLSKIKESPKKKKPQKLKGIITVQNLCFGYTPSKPLFHRLNFHIEPGEKIALIGPSGVGKTSLMHLLLGFYQPTSGKILFDGIDQRILGRENLQSNMAYVPQTMSLFHRTIRENIIYGNGDVSEEELFQAARHSSCHAFIQELPKGYDTIVGEDGLKLSGGQRQRIALARALLKKSAILILDEAFSALDHKNESQILDAILTNHSHKTILLISHRSHSVQKMQREIIIK